MHSNVLYNVSRVILPEDWPACILVFTSDIKLISMYVSFVSLTNIRTKRNILKGF